MSALKTITISFVLTICACMLLFNDLFWFHNQSLMWHHDSEIPYEDTFILASHFFQGGIQLFDRFDTMSFTYNHLGHGLYTLSNILTAFLYVVFSPLFKLPAEAYQHFFCLAFYGLNMLLRTVGGYLLLKRFNLSSSVIVIALVMLNTFLSTTMYFGFVANNLYSYFPLLVFFIMNFVETFRCRDLMCIILVLTVAIAGTPLLGVGYFYQNVHFLLIVAFIYGIIFHRKNMALTKLFKKENLKRLGFMVGICALIMIPWVIMFGLLDKDFYVESSGLSGTEGRFNSMFNPLKYFSPKGESILGLEEFALKLIDFSNTRWEMSWIFWGAGSVLFIIIGLVCSKIRAKYIFLITSILIVLTNLPLNTALPFSIAHWINALTNPFSFLLRSYHMPILLLPYVVFPLIAFGLQSGNDMLTGKISQWRIRTLIVVFMGLLFLSAWQLALDLKVYMLLMLILSLMFLFSIKNKKLALSLFGILMCIDFWALKQYYDSNQYRGDTANRGGYLSEKDGRHIKPTLYDGFEDQRPLLVEYQNPKILPYREYFRIAPSLTAPQMHTFHGHYGEFLRYAPFERFFDALDIYRLRPRIYKDWALNVKLYQNLAQDQRMLALAFQSPDGPRQKLPDRVSQFNLKLEKAQRVKSGSVSWYAIKLPKNFPHYESTAIFTQDRNRFLLNGLGHNFTPVQGAISEPFTFDVNNIKDGYLTIGLPKDTKLQSQELTLILKQSGDILNVWRNTDDQLGVTFLAMAPGWLIVHYPFDTKWQVKVDGKIVKSEVANEYFLSVRIPEGKHQVLFSYWPLSPLRIFIPISIILMFGALWWVLKSGFNHDAINRRTL